MKTKVLNFTTSIFILVIIIIIPSVTPNSNSKSSSRLSIEESICLENGAFNLLPANKKTNLISYWTFDHSTLLDESGNGFHGSNPPEAGPARLIKGQSGYYTGENYSTFENISSQVSTEMSLTFWIYLLEDSNGNWRTLLHKGVSDTELTPTIMLWPKERRLHIRVGTETYWNEGLESKGLLPMKQWTHLSLTLFGQMIQVFINGNLDNEIILKGKIQHNNGQLHLGKDPWRPGVKCLIDDFKVFNSVLNIFEIQQETGGSLTVPQYVKLGCESCRYLVASNSCGDNYHLCDYSEMLSGGYLMARNNGMIKGTVVWYRSSEAYGSDESKAGVCCSN